MKKSHESHRLSSLARVLAAVESRSSGIENDLHYRRDVTLHEDAGPTTATAFNNCVIDLTVGRGWRNLAQVRLLEAVFCDILCSVSPSFETSK